jgi:drug/metabolite transporter (DMT)-like permease
VQECISLTVFLVYVWILFREPLRWNTALAMVFIFVAVWLTFSSVGAQIDQPASAAAVGIGVDEGRSMAAAGRRGPEVRDEG